MPPNSIYGSPLGHIKFQQKSLELDTNTNSSYLMLSIGRPSNNLFFHGISAFGIFIRVLNNTINFALSIGNWKVTNFWDLDGKFWNGLFSIIHHDVCVGQWFPERCYFASMEIRKWSSGETPRLVLLKFSMHSNKYLKGPYRKERRNHTREFFYWTWVHNSDCIVFPLDVSLHFFFQFAEFSI